MLFVFVQELRYSSKPACVMDGWVVPHMVDRASQFSGSKVVSTVTRVDVGQDAPALLRGIHRPCIIPGLSSLGIASPSRCVTNCTPRFEEDLKLQAVRRHGEKICSRNNIV